MAEPCLHLFRPSRHRCTNLRNLGEKFLHLLLDLPIWILEVARLSGPTIEIVHPHRASVLSIPNLGVRADSPRANHGGSGKLVEPLPPPPPSHNTPGR